MSAELIQQHQLQIQISDDDIANAEKVLLWDTGHFSNESKIFIKNLNTVDLCAVPWSGKTTALHAKLLCLEKHLPFQDWSWICILSHTNTAVDEIKEKIALYCPHLFKYPNFIGTIQDFVDTFFVKPYFNNHEIYNKIKVVDDDIYTERLIKSFFQDRRLDTWRSNWKWNPIYVWSLLEVRYYQWTQEKTKVDYIKDEIKISYVDQHWNIHQEGRTKALVSYKSPDIHFRHNIFEKVYKEWIIWYKQAYHFANIILNEEYKLLIKKRFPFVFVDEAQDVNKLQWDLLEKLFWPNDNTITHCYQRIGDPNQAIYSWWAEEWYEWNLRGPLQLINSRRFSHKIANIVEQFGVKSKSEDYNIETNIIGWCNCDDYDSCSCIKPYLIVYDNPLEVLDRYIKIIQHHQNNSWLSDNKYNYTAIGRRWSEASRFIWSYYPPYIKDKIKPKKNYDSCQEYLFYIGRSIVWFAEIQKAILRSISKAITLAWWEFKTTRELITSIKELSETNETYYEDYKRKMRSWCKTIHIGTINSSLVQEIKDFVEDYLIKVNITPITSGGYDIFWNLTAIIMIPDIDSWIEEKSNIYLKDWINIHIQTVHSAKWQTHEATLYMETFYYTEMDSNYLNWYKPFKDDIIKGIDVLNKKVADKLSKWKNNNKTDLKEIENLNKKLKTKKHFFKMLYVWLSRPRKLLCFAIHQENYDIIKWYIDHSDREIIT